MLTNIENRLEELFEMIEMMPQDKVEAAEKVKLKHKYLCKKNYFDKSEYQQIPSSMCYMAASCRILSKNRLI